MGHQGHTDGAGPGIQQDLIFSRRDSWKVDTCAAASVVPPSQRPHLPIRQRRPARCTFSERPLYTELIGQVGQDYIVNVCRKIFVSVGSVWTGKPS